MKWQPTDRDVFLFSRKIDKAGPDDCWRWRGIPDAKGYGHARVAGWGSTAHRVAYGIANGRKRVPDAMIVMHECDNRICCNPAHLKLATQAHNLADMRQKGRAGDCRNFGEQHGRCKVTDAQVAEIFLLRTKKWSQQRIADNMRIGQSQVGRILRGENRAHRRGAYPVERPPKR